MISKRKSAASALSTPLPLDFARASPLWQGETKRKMSLCGKGGEGLGIGGLRAAIDKGLPKV